MLREEEACTAKKRGPGIFSVVKAVKSNARDRVGTPPPDHVLPDEKTKLARRASKHKKTLSRLLQTADEDPGGATP